MKKDKEQSHKLRVSKGELAVRVMAAILAILMFVSVFSTGIYYLYSYFNA